MIGVSWDVTSDSSGDSQHDPWWYTRVAAQGIRLSCSFVSPVNYAVLYFSYT